LNLKRWWNNGSNGSIIYRFRTGIIHNPLCSRPLIASSSI
jgi:hypothetical protein